MASFINNSQIDADVNEPAVRSLTVRGGVREPDKRPEDQEAARWEKYNNVYNYQAPDPSFTAIDSSCGAGPEFAEFFQLNDKHRSRFGEDAVIYKSFFKNRLTGTGAYVELGAFDGKTESNTRFYDICLGWKGLLIEGNPNTYKTTVTNRPQAHRMSFAPSCKEEGTIQFYSYPMANSGLEGKAKTYEGKPTVDVPCGPLGPVLEDIFQGQTINFFSLDVEGAEPMILETIDFGRVKIDVIMVEVENNYCTRNQGCESRRKVRAIMEQVGYKRYNFGSLVPASDVYVHPRTTFSLLPTTPDRLAKAASPPPPPPATSTQVAVTDDKFEKYKFMLPTTPFQQSAPECGSSPDFASFFEMKQKFRSRYNEDKNIYERFFKGKIGAGEGTYVELGAFDGTTESNSRFFDICLGWKGLLIEGNPMTYPTTVKNRPQAIRMSFAPSCKDESTVQFYKYPMANSGLEGKAKTYTGRPTVDVPCGPLGPVLEEVFKGERINFFSLDVEGAEPMVLETIDFEKVKIDVLMVEVENTYCKENCETREQSRATMDKAGYKRYPNGALVAASDVYVHPDSPYFA